MAYKVIILYQLYMPSYFLGTFTEYPYYKLYEDTEIFHFYNSSGIPRQPRYHLYPHPHKKI